VFVDVKHHVYLLRQTMQEFRQSGTQQAEIQAENQTGRLMIIIQPEVQADRQR